MIICFCKELWVINGVLTNKNIFNTNGVAGLKQQNKKNRNFTIEKLLGLIIIK